MNKKYVDLINKIIKEELTLVTAERFYTILRNYDNINIIDGDIVECGTWRGGMSIFMASLFENKNMWVCDSFNGFQPLEYGNYKWEQHDTHNPSYNPMIKVGYDMVVNNFKKYNLTDNRIKFLQGWVKDTLKPELCEIQKISLLRIDVDAYSATREILDYLYPKVELGGYIIFDDSCLLPTKHAIRDYFNQNNIELKLKHPESDAIIDNPITQNLPCGCYIIKEK